MAEHRQLGTWEGLRALDEVIGGLHERLDGAVPVVAGDVELLQSRSMRSDSGE